MTRIVFVSTRPPEPVTSGFAMRIHGILDHIPDGFEVMRIYPKSKAHKYPPHASFAPSAVSRLRELCEMTPSILLPYRYTPDCHEVKKRIADFNPQLVIVSGIHVFPMIPPGFPVLYDAHNVEWHLCRGLIRHSSGSIAVRLHRFITMMKLRRREISIVKKSNFLFACSDNDAAYFSKLTDSQVPVVYNGTDTDYWSIHRNPEKGILLFPGDMSYYPNIDEAEFLVDKVLPELRRRGWKGRLVLCGRDPDLRVKSLAGEDVEVTGTLDDMREYYSRAEILLAPLRIGSGTPLKIITALAAGLPVVTTSRVAASLGIPEGGVVLQADSPEEIASQVLRLIGDQQLAEELSRQGIRLAHEKYSWNAVGSKFWTEVGNCLDSINLK